jgi:hypothetical protein
MREGRRKGGREGGTEGGRECENMFMQKYVYAKIF